jgi:Spy/CpxP family protein refolding chaperone
MVSGNGAPGVGAPAPAQVPANGLMTGGHGGPMPGVRTPSSGNAPMIRAASPFGLGSRWWDDHKTARQLSLRREQQQRMDRIFEANRNTLASLYFNLQAEESRLRGLSAKDREDETKVYAAIDRVTQARAQLQKTSEQIVVQLHQQLDAPQLALMEQASR